MKFLYYLIPAYGDASNESLNSMERRIEFLSTRKFSKPFHSITELCLQREPNNRPSAAQLISHLFFKQCRKTGERLVDILKNVTPIHQRKIEPAGRFLYYILIIV